MLEIPAVLLFSLGFLIIALAAKTIGKTFSAYGLPYITGYLLAGALAGPFLLGLLPREASAELRYIDDISLAVIAFIAGSELFIKELQDRLRSIALNTTGIVVSAFTLIGAALFFLQNVIPFTQGYDMTTRVAVSILGATILLALSPASTIAVIQEARARGPFSKTVLSITVVMDVVIIVLFALAVAFAAAMIEGDPVTVGFLAILALDMLLALGAGYLVGRGIAFMIGQKIPTWSKVAGLLLIGYALFESANLVPGLVEDWTGLKIKVEPLLMAMVAGFTVTNFTDYRHAFEELLHDIAPWIYVAFFTLTGVGLKLDILVATIGIAGALFLVRALAIIVGTYIGGTVAGEAPQFKRFAGLGLITQAGIALGLAREVAALFPDTLGNEFSTLVISVIVLNEIFGPITLKWALNAVGESNVPDGKEKNEPPRLLILGVESQSITLARQMTASGWSVIVADTDEARVEALRAEDVDERVIPDLNAETLSQLLVHADDALVAMLDNDADNLHACQIAHDEFAMENIIVRLQDLSLLSSFREVGARVLDPASAMVHLLERSINAPEAVDLLLHQDPDHEIAQITITQKSVDGIALRDLRLPADVLILEIVRNGQIIVPHGFSTIRLNDRLTLLGCPDDLFEVRFKYGV